MFHIEASGANLHFAQSHILAQAVKDSLVEAGYSNVEIHASEKTNNIFLDVGGISAGETIEFFLNDQSLKIFLSQWPQFQAKFKKWEQKAKDLNRDFAKLYSSRSGIICLSWAEWRDLSFLISNRAPKIDADYEKWMSKI